MMGDLRPTLHLMTTSTVPATALVTGASSGLGLEMARQLAAHGANLILVARSAGKLQELAQELTSRYNIQVHVLPADLNAPGAGQKLHDAVIAQGLQVDILVNNAGLGFFGEFWEQSPADLQRMINVNISALTELTRCFLPGMQERGRGRILNVASTAAFQPGPLMSVYYATKAYVLSFSEALNEELRGQGVSVTALCPGPVRTGFQDVSSLGESRLLTGVMRLSMLSAGEVARQGVQATLRGQSVVIPGPLNQFMAFSIRAVPRALAPRLLAALQARRKT